MRERPLTDESRSHREVAVGVDEDKGSGGAIAPVVVDEQGRGGAQLDARNVIHPDVRVGFFTVQRVDVHLVQHFADHGFDFGSSVPDDVARGRIERLIAHPADLRVEFLHAFRLVVFPDNHVPAGQINVIVNVIVTLWGDRPSRWIVRPRKFQQSRFHAARKCNDFVPHFEDPGSNAPGVASEIPRLIQLRSDDVLDREPAILQVAVAAHVHFFEVLEQGTALVPGHVRRCIDHVIPQQRADGNELDVGHFEPRREIAKCLGDFVVALFREVGQIHLVHAHHEVLDAQQGSNEAVPVRLFHHAVAGVDEDDGEVGSGSSRDHVARVLHVARCIGDDELALGRCEIAVRHIDRDALFAFGTQSIGQQTEVSCFQAFLFAGCLNRFELIFKNAFAVVQQAAQ